VVPSEIFDFCAVAEEGAVFLRNPPPKPEISAPWVFPGFEHFFTHVVSTFVYHRVFAKALFHRSKLNLLGFRKRLAERVGFPSVCHEIAKNTVKQGFPKKAGGRLRPPLSTTGSAGSAVNLGRFRGV
jgi:hypothetical protein